MSKSLKKFSTVKLELEITKRKIVELQNQRSSIDDKIKNLSVIEGKVEKLTKPSSKKNTKIKKSMHKGRVANGLSLKDRLITIAADSAPRSATEFLAVLDNDGWKSTSPKPYYVVSAGLASLVKKNVFRRVEKGSYQLVKRELLAVIA